MEDTSIVTVLRQQGLEPEMKGNPATLLVPLYDNCDSAVVSQFYELFGKASFRKMLNKLCRAHGDSIPLTAFGDDTRGAITAYKSFLSRSGIAEIHDDGIRLSRQVDNIGPTLEWYIMEVFRREFAMIAGWSIHLAGLPAYGDYDVLAWSLNTLIYVETKAKSSKEITERELKHFLQRVEELQPDMALLLIDSDTEIDEVLPRMQTIMEPLIRVSSGITDPDWHLDKPVFQPQPRFPTINWGDKRIYIVNTKRSPIEQMRSCLRLYHTRVKHLTFFGGPYINYVTGEVGDHLQ